MSFSSFFADILATIIGGAILTFFFFLIKEKLFSLPNISGKWYFQTNTLETQYNPYKNMILGYTAVIWKEGNRIEGTIEKIYENSSTGTRNIEGKNRKRSTFQGNLERKYFQSSILQLHVNENAEGRESTTYYELKVKSKDNLDGVFNSMIAEQSGRTIWQRIPFH